MSVSTRPETLYVRQPLRPEVEAVLRRLHDGREKIPGQEYVDALVELHAAGCTIRDVGALATSVMPAGFRATEAFEVASKQKHDPRVRPMLDFLKQHLLSGSGKVPTPSALPSRLLLAAGQLDALRWLLEHHEEFADVDPEAVYSAIRRYETDYVNEGGALGDQWKGRAEFPQLNQEAR